MESTIEFRVLGPLEVRMGGRPLTLRGQKERALLALLLINANRVVARERLIDSLWGDRPPKTAVTSVQIYVSRLRKLLPAGVLVTRPPGYQLVVGPTALDLAEFERLVAEARTAPAREAASLLRAALELWRGPALVEFDDAPFARVEKDRLEETRITALEDRIDADLALGRHAELVGELEALTGAHPHRERLHAQLMLALYRCGRQADALETYREVRDALTELGLEPTRALKDVEQKILRQDHSLDLQDDRRLLADARPPLPAQFVSASPFPFVGREQELESLVAALERAMYGRGELVLLAGEPGAGKTRLIRELAEVAVDRGMLVLYGVSDATVTTPYQPLREWLAFLLRVCDGDVLGDEPATLLRNLAGGRATDRYELQTAAAELVGELSRRQALLVVADDLHWADSGTLQLMRLLARTVPEARVLVVAAYRDPGEEIGPALRDALADLARLDSVTRIGVGKLSADAVGAFVRSSSNAEPSSELVSAIGELSEGTPLLVCELWRELRESGGVEVTDIARLTRPVEELRAPERIRTIVDQRLARFSPTTAAVIEIAAVAGPVHEVRVLAAAAAVDLDALAASLEDATRHGILEELPGGTAVCRFGHELVRRAIYDGLTHIRRATLHLRVGEALERTYGNDAAAVAPQLAHHFTRSSSLGSTARAIEYSVRAAAAANSATAFEEGAHWLANALELGIADAAECARIQVELGWVLAELGRLDEARALLDEAHETATALGDRGLAAHARIEEAWHWHRHGAFEAERVRETAVDAIAVLEELGDTRGLAKARNLLAIAYDTGEGRYAAALTQLERALADAEACGDPLIQSRVMTRLVMNLTAGPTPAEEAIARCEDLYRASRGRPVLQARIDRCLSQLCAMAGRADDARAHERRASTVLDRLPYSEEVASRRFAANMHTVLGETDAAERHLLAMWERFGAEPGQQQSYIASFVAVMLALLCCDAGRWDDAARWLASADADVPETSPPGMLGPAVAARIAAHRGDLGEAMTLVRQAVGFADRTDSLNWRAKVWLAQAEVLRACGRSEEAVDAIDTARRLYAEKGNVAAVL
jgi:DNA-binding SARP family transcriptional activator